MGGACAAPAPGDSDGDGVPDASDNCPEDYNPGQQNSDGDNEGGDACDITVTFPLNGDVTCADPPPTVTWSPETYDRFKVFVGTTATFSTKVTSGKKPLKVTTWPVPPSKWAAICGKAGSALYLKVLGKRRNPKSREYSEIDVLMVK